MYKYFEIEFILSFKLGVNNIEVSAKFQFNRLSGPRDIKLNSK